MHPNCRCSATWTPFRSMVPRKAWDGPAYYEWAQRINDHAVKIVTPGYHSSQGASMIPPSLSGCGDPGCRQCYPQTSARTFDYPFGPMSSFSGMAMPEYSPFSSNASDIKVTINTAYSNALKALFEDALSPTKSKEQPMSSSKTQRVIEDLRTLDEKELPSISTELEAIKSKNKARIVDSLNGVVDLAAMGKAKLRRFVIAYFVNDEAKTAEGVELGETGYIPEGKVTDENRVWVSGSDYPVKGTHCTMERLRKRLGDSEISYKIKYFDK